MLLFTPRFLFLSFSKTCPTRSSHWTSSVAASRRNPGLRSITLFRPLVGLWLLGSWTAVQAGGALQDQAVHSGGPTPSAQFFSLPMQFEPNVGQTDSRVSFVSRGQGYRLFLTPTQAVFSFHSVTQQKA